MSKLKKYIKQVNVMFEEILHIEFHHYSLQFGALHVSAFSQCDTNLFNQTCNRYDIQMDATIQLF